MAQRFDVIAVNIKTGARRTIAENKTEDNATAIVAMAVIRRGVDEEYFVAEPREGGVNMPDDYQAAYNHLVGGLRVIVNELSDRANPPECSAFANRINDAVLAAACYSKLLKEHDTASK